jgi:DNA-binding MarR family transcriptional regulator
VAGAASGAEAVRGVIEEFLGSTHVFALALQNVLEARILSEVAGAELTAAQIRVLKLIGDARAQTIGDVANFLGVSDPAASKTVDRLVRRKLVLRTEREADRRASELALTEAGRALVGEYECARSRKLAEVFQEVPFADLERTAALLDRVARSIITHTPGAGRVCLQCGIYLKARCLMQQSQVSCPYRERAARRAGGDEP